MSSQNLGRTVFGLGVWCKIELEDRQLEQASKREKPMAIVEFGIAEVLNCIDGRLGR